MNAAQCEAGHKISGLIVVVLSTVLWWWWGPRGAAGVSMVVWLFILMSWAQAEETVGNGLNVEDVDSLPSGVRDALAYIDEWSKETTREGSADHHRERRTSSVAAGYQNGLEDSYVEDHHHGRPQHSAAKELNHGLPQHSNTKEVHPPVAHGLDQREESAGQDGGDLLHIDNFALLGQMAQEHLMAGGDPQDPESDQDTVGDHSDAYVPSMSMGGYEPPVPAHGAEELLPAHGVEAPFPAHGAEELVPDYKTEESMYVHGDRTLMPDPGTEDLLPGYETREPTPDPGVKEPMPGHETWEPMLDHGGEEPMPGYESGQPVLYHEAEEPLPDHGVEPMPGQGVETLIPGYETEGPMPLHGAERPMPGYETDAQSHGHENDAPMPGYGVEEPMPGHENDAPMPLHEADLPMPEDGTEPPMAGQGGEEDNIVETDDAPDYLTVPHEGDEELSTFDVDEEDLPSTHPAEEAEAEDSTGEGFEEEMPPPLDDGVEVDMDEELAKLDVRAGDLLSSLDKKTVSVIDRFGSVQFPVCGGA